MAGRVQSARTGDLVVDSARLLSSMLSGHLETDGVGQKRGESDAIRT